MSPRQTALEVLIDCRKNNGWSNERLKEHIGRSGLDKRDAALTTRLCYGVLQNRNLLDFYCRQILTGKLEKLRPVVRDILHLGLYQILMMDKIPDSAAVNESVNLAKKFCRKEQHVPSLINGVLRNAVRSKNTLKQPEDLATRYSHPECLVNLFRSYVGEQKLESMLEADNAAPETVIQVNTTRITAEQLAAKLKDEGVYVSPHPWLVNCLILGGTGSIDRLSSFKDGYFYVQDAAAKLAVDCAEISEENLVISDCCAAPGGKSFAAGIACKNRGQIISSDIHDHKVSLIQNGAERLGLFNVFPRKFDATVFDESLAEKVDIALVDVPCSGYGIIRKKPDIREKDPDTMRELPELQLAILSNQARYVKPGGVLIYSTCTLVRRENEGVIEKFLSANPDFYTEPLKLPTVFGGNQNGMLTLIPGEYDTDGFFICRLRRKR